MKIYSTLNRIRACSPCTTGWKKLLAYVGTGFDHDAPIDLLDERQKTYGDFDKQAAISQELSERRL